MQTPLETSGETFAYSTSYEDEQSFLAALAASSSRIEVTQIGTSAQGRAINVVRIGYPTAPAYAASPTSGVWVGSQHANEWDGRETLIQFARDLTETADSTLTDYLAAHPVFFITNPNPDMVGDASMDPRTSEGININRDHLRLVAPETRAIADVLGTVQPQILHDMHQGGAEDVDVVGVQYGEADPSITALSTAARVAIQAHLTAQSIGNAIYPGHTLKPSPLHNAAGLRHIVGILTETYGNNIIVDRITYSIEAIKGYMAWHAANAAEIAASQILARHRAAGKAARGAAFLLGEAHTSYGDALPGEDEVTTMAPPASAYRLTSGDHASLSTQIASFGIAVEADGDGWLVPTDQAAYPVIPLLMDPDCTERVVTAARITRSFSTAPAGFGNFRVDGAEGPVVSAQIGLGGEVFNLT